MEPWAALATAVGVLSVALLAYTLWIGGLRSAHTRHPRQ
jgi:hypothetical protein